jgi:hypothetical protein
MNYEAKIRTKGPSIGVWFVMATDYDTGITYITEFHGYDSEERAREYAAWKNGEITKPTHSPSTPG